MQEGLNLIEDVVWGYISNNAQERYGKRKNLKDREIWIEPSHVAIRLNVSTSIVRNLCEKFVSEGKLIKRFNYECKKTKLPLDERTSPSRESTAIGVSRSTVKGKKVLLKKKHIILESKAK